MEYSVFLYHITFSFLLSLLVGLERQIRGRAIGLRTSVLVSIGSFMFVTFSMYVGVPDMSRIAAQVVCGIGFLGAGVIIKDGTNIKGLNTAATLWCNAAIGVLCAGGLVIEATIGSGFILFSNIILRYLIKKIRLTRKKIEVYDDYSLVIEASNKEMSKENIHSMIADIANKNNLNIVGIEMERVNSEVTRTAIDFKVNISQNIVLDQFLNEINKNKGIVYTSFTKTNQEKIEILDDDEL